MNVAGTLTFFRRQLAECSTARLSGKKLIRMGRNTQFCAVSLYVTIIRNVTSTLNEFYM
jgi:hypothetical protein